MEDPILILTYKWCWQVGRQVVPFHSGSSSSAAILSIRKEVVIFIVNIGLSIDKLLFCETKAPTLVHSFFKLTLIVLIDD